jgi:HAD superfamily hydrolase (TIGR01457 family)
MDGIMRTYGAYFFDLDGTVYRSREMVPGADAALEALRGRGAKVMFLTNNGRHTGAMVAERLMGREIHASAEEVLTAADATIQELAEDAPGARVYAISEEPFFEAMDKAGITRADDPAKTDIVVVGFDSQMSFDALIFAHEAVRQGARIWATNPDVCYPTDTGECPHTGAILAAIEASTGKKAERIVGKPAPGFLHVAQRRIGIPLAECLMVGDRLDTDIMGAHNAGMHSALVLTGISTPESLQEAAMEPTYVIDSIVDLVQG